MALGLSHSLSRYKLKFSPDKVDTMIVQAIGEFIYRFHSCTPDYLTSLSSLCLPLTLPPSFPPSLPPALLDDLDKELNNYAMRLREWYGWHFPELNKIVTDNLTYARTVKALGKLRVYKNSNPVLKYKCRINFVPLFCILTLHCTTFM